MIVKVLLAYEGCRTRAKQEKAGLVPAVSLWASYFISQSQFPNL